MTICDRGLARSSSPDVRNPLLKLPAAAALAVLPEVDRRRLRGLLDEIRREARARGDVLWSRRKFREAAFWRACSVYAGHAARLVSARPVPTLAHPEVQRIYAGPNPVLALSAAQALRSLPSATRAAVRSLLLQLRAEAAASSIESWRRCKSPMSSYWADVSAFAGDAARFLRDEHHTVDAPASAVAQRTHQPMTPAMLEAA